MKRYFFYFFILMMALSSCNPAERKAAKRIGEEAVQTYRKFSKSEAGKVVKTVNRINTIERIVDQQPSYHVCSQCGGYGYVAGYDMYGNIITDYYGNPIPYCCPNCGGYGYVVY